MTNTALELLDASLSTSAPSKAEVTCVGIEAASDKLEQASTATPTSPCSAVSGSSDSPKEESKSQPAKPPPKKVTNVSKIVWDELSFGAQIEPHHRHARTPEDIYLLNTFLELSKVEDVEANSVKRVLGAIKFLRSCSYSSIDLCSILAHASAYFAGAYEVCGQRMSLEEQGFVLVVSMYLAHSYTQDETCPLKIWHQYLFKKYCKLKVLNLAVMQVMAFRKHVLRLHDDDLRIRNEALWAAAGEQIQRPMMVVL